MNTSTEPPALSAATALFLDFDGTLVPVAPRPQDVKVPAWVLPTLQAASGALSDALAIVSGRPIAQLDAFLAPLRLSAAGEHGAEWREGAGQIERRRADPPLRVLASARGLAANHVGLLFEPKSSGFALHYRARPELETLCRDELTAALAAEPDAPAWQWLQGHCVLELKQRAVSKGSAVRTLLTRPAFAGRRPVFIGDDVTDEDGIRAVQEAGGFGVRVGPGASQARYRLAHTDAVATWLSAGLQAFRRTDREGATP
ncbi:MAG: trehalose-phosphatase [Burkholderiales bacterium]